MYDPKSTKAEEFIDDAEILATLSYAAERKNDETLVDAILDKARKMQGLTHREALE